MFLEPHAGVSIPNRTSISDFCMVRAIIIIIDFIMAYCRGGSMGGTGGAPYFWQSQFFILHCIQCLKNIFEIEFGFYSGRNPRSFWKCGGPGGVGLCVCVCESKSWPLLFFCSAKASFWIISEVILIPKIYARLQEIASLFSKISGEASRRRWRFRRSVRGFAPLMPPFPKFLDPPMYCVSI